MVGGLRLDLGAAAVSSVVPILYWYVCRRVGIDGDEYRALTVAMLLAHLTSCASSHCTLPNRPLRVVCAGDSITRGNTSGGTATDPLAPCSPNTQPGYESNTLRVGCWPCELKSMLAHGNSVRNIGVSAATATAAPHVEAP